MKYTGAIVFVCSILASLGWAERASAWSAFGHLAVCDLAYRNFTKTTRTQLDVLLEVRKGGIVVRDEEGTALRRYTSFNLGCLEEDEFPRRREKDHFINVARDTPSISGAACPGGGDCIISGIERDLAILKDKTRSNRDRVFALMALGHWIGDIHQPLHVSFADDRGGNQIKVRLSGRCGTTRPKPQELHKVWDECLLQAGMFERVRKRDDFKAHWKPRTITYRAVDTLQYNTKHSEEMSLIKGEPWRWADESYAITVDPEVLYCVKSGANCQYSQTEIEKPSGAPRLQLLDQSYLAKFERVAEERVRKAGFRLAHLVNSALDPDYSEPIQNSEQRP